jgi:hypothetical protein
VSTTPTTPPENGSLPVSEAAPKSPGSPEKPSGTGPVMSHDKPTRKPWGEARKSPSRLPRSTQTRVVVASAAGRTQREISRELGLSRNTVARVLSQAEHQEMLGLFRDQLLNLVPEALRVAKRRLRQNSEKMATEVLKGTQVMVVRTEQDVHHRINEFEGWTDEQLEQYTRSGERPGVIAVQPKGTA